MTTASFPAPTQHMAEPTTPYDGIVFNKGDLQLVSFDDVEFTVDSLKVSAASPVLRDMAATSGRPVHVRESGSALQALLAIIIAGEEPFAHAPNVVQDLATLQLLVKYDCKPALTYATTTLKCLLMEGDVCPFQSFILGAHLGDLDLCRTAIVHGDVPPLDAGAQTLLQPYRDALPAVYADALRDCWNSSTDPKARGNMFIELMSLSDSDDGSDFSH